MRAYLDNNVFVFACVSAEAIGKDCRNLLHMVVKGKIDAVTTLLTFDELFYKLNRLKGFDAAVLFTENFLAMPNLALCEVDSQVVAEAFDVVKQYKLAPRDAIHVATAVLRKADCIVSDDKEFLKVAGMRLVSVKGALKEAE